MRITIKQANPYDAAALLQASHALMDDLFPAEACHYMDIEALCTPNVLFYIVVMNNQTVGCGALVQYDTYCEVKSMFVDPSARGQGIGAMIMTHIERKAQALGHRFLCLETGELLKDAMKLYEKYGFERCRAFGAYPEHPLSTFMQKVIA